MTKQTNLPPNSHIMLDALLCACSIYNIHRGVLGTTANPDTCRTRVDGRIRFEYEYLSPFSTQQAREKVIIENNRDSKPHFQCTQASHAGTHSHYTSLLILTICCTAPDIKSLHLVSPGYIRVYTPVVYPFPALKFHLHTTILIHRMRGSALGGLSLVWGIRAETSDSIAPT